MPAASSSYSARSWNGDNSISWDATNARTDRTIDTKAICLGQTAGSYILSQQLTDGCSQVSFKHQQQFSGSGGTITLFINDVKIGESVSVSTNVQLANFSGISVSGAFRIKLVSNGASRIAIDNLAWDTEADNFPPNIVSVTQAPQVVYTNQTVSFVVEITNDDGAPAVELVWGDTPENMTFSSTMHNDEGLFFTSIVIPSNFTQLSYTITATDNGGLTASSQVFTVAVLPNILPVINSVEILPIAPNSSESVLVKSSISDVDNDVLNVQVLWGLSSTELVNSVDMIKTSDFYEGSIPPNASGATVFYQVIANDGKGGIVESDILSYSVLTTVNLEPVSVVSTYPNPASSVLNVSGQLAGLTEYKIIDISGKVVLQGNISLESGFGSIELNGITNGLYLLKIIGKTKVAVVRFTVSK